MKTKLKIWHFLLFIFLLILLFRINFLLNSASLLLLHINLLFIEPLLAIDQIGIEIFDYYFSFLLIVAVPFILYLFRKRLTFLFLQLDFTNAFITILIIFSLLAPAISPSNYDSQHNVSVSKLLPPFSSKKIITLKKKRGEDVDVKQKFVSQRNVLFNKGLTGEFYIADEIKTNNREIILYQKSKEKKILLDQFEKNYASMETSNLFFLFGTDEFGRDLFTRLIYGTRLSIFIGLGSIIIIATIGITLGFLAGYFGGYTDTIINRISDIFLSFPNIFMIILIVGLFGNSVITVVAVLGLLGWMSLFKIIRNESASLKSKDFILTSKLLGFSNYQILFREMLPIILPSIIVNLVLQYGNVIMTESALSFLGLGLGNNYPTWGAMIDSGQNYLAQAWWISLFPCLFLFLTLLAANNFGKKLKKDSNLITSES